MPNGIGNSSSGVLAAGDVGSRLAPQCIDVKELFERVDGDMQLLREIIRLFREDGSRTLVQLVEAVARRDAEAIYFAAHKLKGSVANFAAKEAYQLARNVELMGRSGNLTGVDEATGSLCEAVSEVQEALACLVTG